jgi:hypothetical protein
MCNRNSTTTTTTYKVFNYEPGTAGEIIVARNVRWEHWEHPSKIPNQWIHHPYSLKCMD